MMKRRRPASSLATAGGSNTVKCPCCPLELQHGMRGYRMHFKARHEGQPGAPTYKEAVALMKAAKKA